MSSTDVFPARNLGAAEDWGRKVEGRTTSAERRIENLTQRVNQLTFQVNSLAGTALPGLAQIPSYSFQSASDKNVALTSATTWVTLLEQGIVVPEGSSQMIVTVSGTLQLTGTSPDNNAPWVRISGGFGNSYQWYLPDPGAQGVRSANNSGGVFLATVSASILLGVPTSGSSELTIRLEGWASSATDFATPTASNLGSLFTQITAFPQPLVTTEE